MMSTKTKAVLWFCLCIAFTSAFAIPWFTVEDSNIDGAGGSVEIDFYDSMVQYHYSNRSVTAYHGDDYESLFPNSYDTMRNVWILGYLTGLCAFICFLYWGYKAEHAVILTLVDIILLPFRGITKHIDPDCIYNTSMIGTMVFGALTSIYFRINFPDSLSQDFFTSIDSFRDSEATLTWGPGGGYYLFTLAWVALAAYTLYSKFSRDDDEIDMGTQTDFPPDS